MEIIQKPNTFFSKKLVKMEIRRKLKLLTLLLSIVMFLFQLRIAIINLISPSTVVSTREIDISEIDLPLITVCPVNQTNTTMLTKLGYQSVDYLFKGHTKCNGEPCLSWGAILNMTFDETVDEVFNPGFYKGPKSAETQRLLARYGICQEITQEITQEPVSIFYYKDSRVFITDKQYRTYFSLDFSSQIGNKIVVESKKEHNFNVKVVISSSCLISSAEERNHEFGSCIEDKIQETVQGKKLDCIAPWLSENNQCNKTFPVEFYKEIPKSWNELYFTTRKLMTTDLEDSCRKSCMTTSFIVEEIETIDVRTSNGRANLHFDPKVVVNEKMHNYNLFQFIIDVGSSLGLWLGLSVFGLHDLAENVFDYISNSKAFKNMKSAF